MPSNVSKGRGLEYAVRDCLKAEGYIVFRCAGSRPVDLVAIREGKIILLECKTGKNPSLPPKQLKHILEISERVGGSVVLAVRKKYRKIRWFKTTKLGIKEAGHVDVGLHRDCEEVWGAEEDLGG